MIGKNCKLHFGAYVQVHEDQNVTNTLKERTLGAICLSHRQPTGQLCIILLRSGKRMIRRQFTEVPTPTIVVKRVAETALAKKRTKDVFLKTTLALL